MLTDKKLILRTAPQKTPLILGIRCKTLTYKMALHGAIITTKKPVQWQ